MSDKHSLEFNKLAASILLAGVIAMICGILADGIYEPKTPEKRGFHVEVAEDAGADAGKPEVQVDVGTLLASADAAKGNDLVQKKCVSCHDFSQGGPNKVGPNLYGIVGRGVGSKGDFPYSDAVKNHGGTWGYDELNQWLKGPAQFIKGNKMGFPGIKNEQERADVIMYLKSISPSAPAIPAPKPAAAAGAAPEAGKNAASPAVSDAKNSGKPSGPGPSDTNKNVQNKVDASKDAKNPQANKEKDSGNSPAGNDTERNAVKQESKKATGQ